MTRLLALLCLLLNGAISAQAQNIVADLSQNRVSITASFSGSRIVVFGAIRPETGTVIMDPDTPSVAPMDIIVTVSGPLQPVTVRKKDRRAGIWVNSEALQVDLAPTFYKVASTRPLGDILSETDDLRHKISVPLAIRATGGAAEVGDTEAFVEALIRIRENDGQYEEMPNQVDFSEQTLFRTDIDLPANLVEGNYTTRIFLTQEKAVIADFTRVLAVRKVGIERWVYTLAQEQALIYGLLSLAIAIAAGWSASAVFRYIRG